MIKKLDQCLSKHNQILFNTQNHISSRVSDHAQIHNWSLQHTEEEMRIMEVHKISELLKILKNLKNTYFLKKFFNDALEC